MKSQGLGHTAIELTQFLALDLALALDLRSIFESKIKIKSMRARIIRRFGGTPLPALVCASQDNLFFVLGGLCYIWQVSKREQDRSCAVPGASRVRRNTRSWFFKFNERLDEKRCIPIFSYRGGVDLVSPC